MSRAARLRLARPEDADGIVALEQHFPSDRMAPASIRRLLRSPSALIWVAERGGDKAIVGAVIVLTRRGAAGARIYSLVVSPQARGQGLGRRLVEAAEQGALRDGYAALSLEVREDNAVARALYADLGYAQALRMPGYYDDGAPGLRLRKRLG